MLRKLFSNVQLQPVFQNNNSLYSANKFYFKKFIPPHPPLPRGTGDGLQGLSQLGKYSAH